MSEQKHILEIEPIRYKSTHERYMFRNYRCPVCNGYGHFQPEQQPDGDYISKECDYCEGTGKVKAEVEVKWSADLE